MQRLIKTKLKRDGIGTEKSYLATHDLIRLVEQLAFTTLPQDGEQSVR